MARSPRQTACHAACLLCALCTDFILWMLRDGNKQHVLMMKDETKGYVGRTFGTEDVLDSCVCVKLTYNNGICF